MENILIINKPIGKTPFEIVQKLKELRPDLKDKKIGYAGRLDPMAEGVLILLIGELNKNKAQFEGLEKKYTFEAVLGIETDTYDLLGIVQNYHHLTFQKKQIKTALISFIKTFSQPYPPYSSARVKGKPLFYWARNKALNTITIPSKSVSIYSIQDIQISKLSPKKLHTIIKKRINTVSGNFRQQEILATWEEFFSTNISSNFTVVKASVHCSSGTYIRSLIHNFGQKLESCAVTVSIQRTSVGPHELQDAVNII